MMAHKGSSHPDQRYIDALAANRREVVQEIYDRFFGRIKKYILDNSGKDSDAKDIFQEALIAIFQKLKKESLQINCPFEAYLLAVCKRLWWNELKKRKRKGVTNTSTELLKDEADPTFLLSEETFFEQERDRFFWEKFQQLGPRCQELLRLSWTGLDMKKVAAKIDMTYAYARKKKSQCTERLMKLIQQDAYFKTLKFHG